MAGIFDSPCRVLIVEDHADSAELLLRLLKHKGHQTQVAFTLAAATRACRESSFDVVLCDINLPDGSGLDLARIIKAECPQTVAIALTGLGMPAEVRDILAAGFDAHILKPVNFKTLLETLATVDCARQRPVMQEG